MPLPPRLAWLRLLPLSREGGFLALVALAMLLTGLAKSINLMTLLACLLLVTVGLNYLLARRQLGGVRVSRLAADPAFAATPWRCAVQVRNDGPREAQAVRVQAGAQGWFLPTLPAGETRTLQTTVVFPRRGRVTTEAVRLVSGYPLGLARVTKLEDGGEELIVLPRVGTVQRAALHAFFHFRGQYDGQAPHRSAAGAAAQTVFHGLRSYRSGDSPRTIHWRTSARRGELMVREFEDPPGDDLTVVVDATGPADGRERSISLAATVCWEWCRQTGDRLVLAVAGADVTVVGGVTGRPLALQLLEALALEPGADAGDVDAAVRRLQAERLPAGPVLVLGGPRSPLAAALGAALPRPVVGLAAGSEKEGKLFTI